MRAKSRTCSVTTKAAVGVAVGATSDVEAADDSEE